MPLPLILGIGAAIAGVAGVGSSINGAVKMKNANDTSKEAKLRHEKNVVRFNYKNKETTKQMDALGKLEMEIISSFQMFSDIIEKIQNRPNFKAISQQASIPEYTPEDLKVASTGAAVLLGGVSGAITGTFGGFAAAGATTAAVMALGTASTGTAIASLSGAAATNATLAALGGGAIAAGGGGMALGSAVLGGATLGVGLLVGGIIFNVTGDNLQKKADESYEQMLEAEKQINKIIDYLIKLRKLGEEYFVSLSAVNDIYTTLLDRLDVVVNENQKTDWNDFTDEEKLLTENLVLSVGLLYSMCKVQLVEVSDDENETNKINYADADERMNAAKNFIDNNGEVA